MKSHQSKYSGHKLGKPRSLMEIMACGDVASKKPATGRSTVMDSLKSFDNDDDIVSISSSASMPVGDVVKKPSSTKKSLAKCNSGGKKKPTPIREDDEDDDNDDTGSIQSMPTGNKKKKKLKSKSVSGGRPSPNNPKTISESDDDRAQKSPPEAAKRGRKLDVLRKNPDGAGTKKTRSSSLGALGSNPRDRSTRKQANDLYSGSGSSSEVRKPIRKSNYKEFENLDKEKAFSVSLDGASNHSTRSLGPVRKPGEDRRQRGRSRSTDRIEKKHERPASAGALQPRRRQSSTSSTGSSSKNDSKSLKQRDENTPADGGEYRDMELPLKTGTKQTCMEVPLNDAGDDDDDDEHHVLLSLKPPSKNGSAKKKDALGGSTHSSSSNGRRKKKKVKDDDDDEKSLGGSSTHSSGRRKKKKQIKENDDDKSLGGSSTHSTKSSNSRSNTGRRQHRDSEEFDKKGSNKDKRSSSIGPLNKTKNNKKKNSEGGRSFWDLAESSKKLNLAEEASGGSDDDGSAGLKKSTSTGSLGRLFGLGRNKKSIDSDAKIEEENGDIVASSSRGNNKDESIDGSSQTMKSAKSSLSRGRRAPKRSSSLGPLDGRGARGRNSRTGKDDSMDGSSHTMKSARSSLSSRKAPKRSSSLGPLDGRGGSRARNKPGKTDSMDGSSHTMKSAKGARGRKPRKRRSEDDSRASVDTVSDNDESGPGYKKKAGKSIFEDSHRSNNVPPPKESIELHASTDTFESMDTFESVTSFGEDEVSSPENTKTPKPLNEPDIAENASPANEMKTKVAEMAFMYLEFKKKASEVKQLKGEDDSSHDGDDNEVGDDETTGAMRSMAVASPQKATPGSAKHAFNKMRSAFEKASPGEPTSEGATASSVSKPAVASRGPAQTGDYDGLKLRMDVVRKREELLEAERAIFEKEKADSVDERTLALRRKEEVFATERAAFEMEKTMFLKEKQATADERTTKISKLEELIATERAKFQKEKETTEQEHTDMLNKERAQFRKETDESKAELEEAVKAKQSLEKQLEESKQKNEDFKRVLNILSKQLEKDGNVQPQTDDHLSQLAGLTNADDEFVCDDGMFFEED